MNKYYNEILEKLEKQNIEIIQSLETRFYEIIKNLFEDESPEINLSSSNTWKLFITSILGTETTLPTKIAFSDDEQMAIIRYYKTKCQNGTLLTKIVPSEKILAFERDLISQILLDLESIKKEALQELIEKVRFAVKYGNYSRENRLDSEIDSLFDTDIWRNFLTSIFDDNQELYLTDNLPELTEDQKKSLKYYYQLSGTEGTIGIGEVYKNAIYYYEKELIKTMQREKKSSKKKTHHKSIRLM